VKWGPKGEKGEKKPKMKKKGRAARLKVGHRAVPSRAACHDAARVPFSH
jgi:hypothetical protein